MKLKFVNSAVGKLNKHFVTGTVYRNKYHFYSLAVKAGVYIDVGRVVDPFLKLSNVLRG